MRSSFLKLTLWLLTVIVVGSPSILAQSGGKLTGKVTGTDGKPIAGVTINVTNQTTTDTESNRSRSDGSYSFNLKAGAYRITVSPPYEARFDRGKTDEYGIFSN